MHNLGAKQFIVISEKYSKNRGLIIELSIQNINFYTIWIPIYKQLDYYITSSSETITLTLIFAKTLESFPENIFFQTIL